MNSARNEVKLIQIAKQELVSLSKCNNNTVLNVLNCTFKTCTLFNIKSNMAKNFQSIPSTSQRNWVCLFHLNNAYFI